MNDNIKELYTNYCFNNFMEYYTMDDKSEYLGIIYTTTEDTLEPLELIYNFTSSSYQVIINDVLKCEEFATLETLADDLRYCNFDDFYTYALDMCEALGV